VKKPDPEFVDILNNLDTVFVFSGDLMSALQVWVSALAEVSRAGAAVAKLLNNFYAADDVRLTKLLNSFASHYDERIVNFKTKKLVEMVQNQWIPNIEKFQNNLLHSFVEMVKERHEKQKAAEHYHIKVEKLKATDLSNRAKGKIPNQKDREKLTRNEEKLNGAKSAYETIRQEVNLKMNHAFKSRFQFLDVKAVDFVKTDFFFHDSVARSLATFKDELKGVLKQPIYSVRVGEPSHPDPPTVAFPEAPTANKPAEVTNDDEFAAFASFGDMAEGAAPGASPGETPADDPFNLGGTSGATDPFNLDSPPQPVHSSPDPFSIDAPTQTKATSDPFNLDAPDLFNAPPGKKSASDPFPQENTSSDPFDPFQSTTPADPFSGVANSDDPFSLGGPPVPKKEKKKAAVTATVMDPFAIAPPSKETVKQGSGSDELFSMAEPKPSTSPAEPLKQSDPFDLGGFSSDPALSQPDDPFANLSIPDTQEPDTSDPFSIAAPAPTKPKTSTPDTSDPFSISAPAPTKPKTSTPDTSDPFSIAAPAPTKPKSSSPSGDLFALSSKVEMDGPNRSAETNPDKQNPFADFGAFSKPKEGDFFQKAEITPDPFSVAKDPFPAEPKKNNPFGVEEVQPPEQTDDPFAGLAIPSMDEPVKTASEPTTNPFEKFSTLEPPLQQNATSQSSSPTNPFTSIKASSSSDSTNPFF